MAKQKHNYVEHAPLSTILNSEEIIEAAFGQPKMKINPRSKKIPSLDEALKAVTVEIEQATVRYVAEQYEPKLQEAYETFVLIHGERPEDADEAEVWDDQADAMVEETLEDYIRILSQDWLGTHTIGSGIHEEGGVSKFAHSLGKEYYKQITYGKTPAQIMSSAGIVKESVEARLASHVQPTEKEKQAMAEQQDTDLNTVIEKIADHIGKDHDVMAVYDDLDLVSDDDDGLAFGAAARLGIAESDVDTLRIVRLEHGRDTVDVLQHAIQKVLDGDKPEKKKAPAKKAKEAKPAPAEKAPKPEKKAPASTASGADGSVLAALKANGAPDTDTAKGLGFSRTTYTNIVNGKSKFTPTEDQVAFLRGLVVDKLNELHEALGKLDGNEPEVVF